MASSIGQRPYSIRTRIKTLLQSSAISSIRGQRPYSIRTRIKTYRILNITINYNRSETIFH